MTKTRDTDDYDDEETEEEPRAAKKKSGETSDLMKLGGGILSNINYKVAVFLFFIGMLIFSDIFIDGVIGSFDGAASGECTTTKGTMIQLMFMVLAYVVLDIAVKYEWL